MTLILIIEDAWFTRRAICKILQGSGYETLEAANGREGLEIVASRPDIDCMLLDLLMPEVDGWGVLKALREQQSQLPVIVLTADIQESTRLQCLELGAFTVINKPPKPEELRHVLQAALSASEESQP
ncbi:response regulator [Microcoleus sp. FACHB-68]|uniref:response regulator n=1 Tax=Microcoleus sp. FACHB-68 TaxID=2692826 RepID=UPI0016844C01|nr:response regulator [Microcoleus sp. FACHB-68]MBD1938848.1 response regulator [Microcoleus sp. FACHB-68]